MHTKLSSTRTVPEGCPKASVGLELPPNKLCCCCDDPLTVLAGIANRFAERDGIADPEGVGIPRDIDGILRDIDGIPRDIDVAGVVRFGTVGVVRFGKAIV